MQPSVPVKESGNRWTNRNGDAGISIWLFTTMKLEFAYGELNGISGLIKTEQLDISLPCRA
jgi:hypothetical protein